MKVKLETKYILKMKKKNICIIINFFNNFLVNFLNFLLKKKFFFSIKKVNKNFIKIKKKNKIIKIMS
jgi:ADP-heptose:LPS heptosyltransferase